jgi:hypothetical protein
MEGTVQNQSERVQVLNSTLRDVARAFLRDGQQAHPDGLPPIQ